MTAADGSTALRRIAQDIRSELASIDETAGDAKRALIDIQGREPKRIEVYGAASIVAAFYTGIEKVFQKIAPELNGGVPAGPAWHRRLLENMTIEIPGVRPRVVTRDTAEALEEFLAFRHRFRNLYLFNLKWDRVRALLQALPDSWRGARAELDAFVAWLDQVGQPPA